MSGIIESASAILSASERRMEAISGNITNVSTPGFKRQLSFTDFVGGSERSLAEKLSSLRTDFAPAPWTRTGNPLDLAIGGSGFFQLRRGEEIVYSRAGQFSRSDEGRIVNAAGDVLQANGGDLILEREAVEILADGTVLDGERPVARIDLFVPTEGTHIQPLGGSSFSMSAIAADGSDGSEMRQGMLEASNVSLADEMVSMMTALRHAEGGARLIQLYDELIGRAITTLGQGAR